MNALMLIGLIGAPVAGAQFGVDYSRAIWGDDQIWWTPATMALPLEQTRGSFQLFLDNEPIQNHLERRSLTALDTNGLAYFVAPELFKVRLNNWAPVKASLLHKAVYSAFALGVSLTCLVVGLIQFFRQPLPRRRVVDGQARPIRR
ncbi:hypothetical protein CKO27_15995 [Thiocystis violacea]|nr:hypothetical protein [Thiocystis violacea]